MAEKLKLDPAGPIVFTGPFQKSQTIHQGTNISPNRITTKVKCSDTASIQVSPVFAVIEPNQTVPFKFQCRFADGNPNPKKQYMFAIVVADAPADLTADVAKIKDAWATIKDMATIKLTCQFRQPGEQPPPPPAAEAAPAAEAPAAEAPVAEAPAAEAPLADAPPAEEPPAQ